MYVAKDIIRQPLYVICCIFNPVRFKSRWALYRDFQTHVRQSGAILITVEAAFGEREFALEDHAPALNPGSQMPPSRGGQDYIKLRVASHQEIWLKENLLNLGAQHLPPDARYVAFVDADVRFSRPDWVTETIHALQHYDVVQMFSTAIDLSPRHEPLQAHRSFGADQVGELSQARPGPAAPYAGDPSSSTEGYSTGRGIARFHPGFAWAWRVDALNRVGGLLDRAITGPADHHMAWALVGQTEKTIHGAVTPAYREMVLNWQEAVAQLRGNVGYIDGTLLHHWHGPKVARGYESRWQILIDSAYDPTKDVRPDARGVLGLTGNKPKLRDDLRRYFRSRSEDDISVPDEDHRILGPQPGWP